MNKNKTHTPGPWRFANGDRFDGGGQEPSEYQYLVLAEKETIIASFWDSYGWGDQAKANAHLIAAAPELLAALKIIKGLLDESGSFSIARRDEKAMDMNDKYVLGTIFERADAAIAKAEGR